MNLIRISLVLILGIVCVNCDGSNTTTTTTTTTTATTTSQTIPETTTTATKVASTCTLNKSSQNEKILLNKVMSLDKKQ